MGNCVGAECHDLQQGGHADTVWGHVLSVHVTLLLFDASVLRHNKTVCS